MKRRRHRSNVTKAALIIVSHILVIVMSASFIWIVFYPALREEIFAGKPAKKYEDSRNFADQMLNYCQQAMYRVRGTDLFETEGKYNPDKIVDIEVCHRDNTISGKEHSGLAYRLGDLIEWPENTDPIAASAELMSDSTESTGGIVVCKTEEDTYHYYKMSEFNEMLRTGQFQLDIGDEKKNVGADGAEEALFSEGEVRQIRDKDGKIIYVNVWIYDGYWEKERFAPIGADSVIEIVNNDPRWNGRLEEAYRMISIVKNSLQEQYKNYQSVGEDVEKGDTNLSYIYVNTLNQKIYTNRSEYKTYENLAANIKEMEASGKYVIVKPKLADFDTNMKAVEAPLWRDMVKYAGMNEDDFIFIAAVDTKYPIQDVFYTENQLYAKYGAGARRVAIFACIAAVLFAVCLVWLAVVAGRNDKDEELCLNAFDRWKTEPAAIFVIMAWIIPVSLLSAGTEITDVFSRISDALVFRAMPSYIAVGAMAAVYTCSMFLVGFLSLVRRIKAKTLWENSICRGALVFAKDLFNNLNRVWKTVVLFGFFVLIHWAAVLTAASINEALIVIMLLADALALVYLVYISIGRDKIRNGIHRISGGEVNYEVPLEKLMGDQREIAREINSIGKGLERAVAESMKRERLKTDLITNVSHDIKTPLTSIINYVELLKQEHFEDPKVQRYIEVLEQKSQRLKTLTEDVVEASRISSGNISIEYMNLNLAEMIQQVRGEFEEKFQTRNLREILIVPEEDVVIHVDGRRMWRVFENIYNNAAKYAMEGTRIYAELSVEGENAVFSLKNISEQALNIPADELTERFIRGDLSRSTEGSGLGLSIAKTLTQMQGGTFELYLDGDLFKVILTFPRVK